MGTVYPMICDKCGHNFRASFGVGFLFPSVYAEVTVSAKSGELGAELKKFFTEHPNGAIDVSNIFGVCKQCGEFDNVKNLSMYLPADDFSPAERQGRWSVAFPFERAEYVAPKDLKEHYKLFAKYPHKCKHCGGEMEIFNEDDFAVKDNFECPRCHNKLVPGDEIIFWD